jgi:hypothetical protein
MSRIDVLLILGVSLAYLVVTAAGIYALFGMWAQ